MLFTLLTTKILDTTPNYEDLRKISSIIKGPLILSHFILILYCIFMFYFNFILYFSLILYFILFFTEHVS